MKKILFGVLLFLSMSFLPSCKDDVDPPPTKTELLTKASWKFKSATANGTDVSSTITACQKDNTYTYNASGTGTMDEGATKCNAADPQTRPANWNFSNNETTLNLTNALFTGGATTLTIISLSDTELVVSFPYTPPSSSLTLTVVVTFMH